MNKPETPYGRAQVLASAVTAAPYIGNGAYCYANATAMLLASHGETVTPATIEVLSGVGLGAAYRAESGEMYFSDPNGLPDTGVTRALEILGLACAPWSAQGPDAPLAALAVALDSGPVMLGPMDMGLLRYHPLWEWLGGSDHYVLATAIEDGCVRLHDPDGLPCVALPLDELANAWRAEKVFYRSGDFQAWHSPRRFETPSAAQVRERAMDWFRERVKTSPGPRARPDERYGVDAICACAADLAAGAIPESLQPMLVHFSLKLGVRRALDFAQFFDAIDPVLAADKRAQADAFGLAHCAAMRKEWKKLANVFLRLADIEARIHARLTA